jgi:DNA polymerase I-like protein with 3'-5' exonuclease and polymerase domains
MSRRSSGARGRAIPKEGMTEGIVPPDFSAWATRLIDELPEDTPADELALLHSQLRSLTTRVPAADLLPPDRTAPHVVRDRKSLKQVAAQVVGADEVVIDLETSSLDPRSGEIVGVGLATASVNYYMPIGHRFAETGKLRPDQLPLYAVVRDLCLHQLPLVAHNAKFEFRWLRHHAGVSCRFLWDVMLAARLLRSDLPAELENLAIRELDVPNWGLTKADIARLQFLPIERVARYCGKDCRYTLELYWRQRSCLA